VLGAPAGDIEVKKRIAYLPESPYFYEHMTAMEVVTFYAQLFGMKTEDARKKAAELVDFVGLGGKGDRGKRIVEFSKGMRQRVGIAQSLINDPDLLFYDEPTSGLDAIARRDIRDLMLELKHRARRCSCRRTNSKTSKRSATGSRSSTKANCASSGASTNCSPANSSRWSCRAFPRTRRDDPHHRQDGRSDRRTRTSVTMRNTPEAVSAVSTPPATPGEHHRIEPKRRTLEDLFVQVVGERIVVDAAGNATTEAVPSSSNGTNGAATYSANVAQGEKPTTSARRG
jgi:ABC-2 type transport system ATP-binding protein